MSNAEELSIAIAAKGEEIRLVKAEKAPTMKDDLSPLIAELLALKTSYKNITGEDFGVKPEVKKDKKVVEETKKEGPSKSELSKIKKKEAIAAAKARDAALAAENGNASPVVEIVKEKDESSNEVDNCAHLYGDAPLITSSVMTDRVFKQINDLTEDRVGQTVWLRGRVGNSRAVGKGIFLLLRQQMSIVQAVMFQSEKISKAMIKYGAGISLESIVDIRALITKADSPIQSASVKNIELVIEEIHVISRAQELPFLVDDAGRSEADSLANNLPSVNADTALNFRWVDLRTPANQAIFRIQSGVCSLFREYFSSKNFIEIHTPKLIGGASEGGANVFNLQYFGQPACLAQSPQLYKQMTAGCGGFDRVFEIGPVFRAENSNTHRHLCEFTGMDFEMAIYEHYYEALDVMAEMFHHIFDGLNEKYQHELKVISQQYPFEPLKFTRPALRITFQEGITMLRESGVDAPFDEDISTPHEKALGKLVREKYDTDFYIMDKYPLSVRPFYTMPDPANPKLSNSYDLFIRGEEIVSGAQRIHDPTLLVERANAHGIPLSGIQSYIDAFKHGAQPHAGGGVGMERVVMLFLGLKNIRKTSMFPRDPSRLTP